MAKLTRGTLTVEVSEPVQIERLKRNGWQLVKEPAKPKPKAKPKATEQ